MDAFNRLNDFLVTQFGPLGPLFATGMLGVLLISAVLPFLVQRRADPLDKLRDQVPHPSALHKPGNQTQAKANLRQKESSQKLDKFATFLEPQDEGDYSEARKKMMQAGYRSKTAIRTYHLAQFALGVSLLIFGALMAILTSSADGIKVHSLLLWIILPGLVGYYMPAYWVERRRQARQEEIVNGFPDSLDMMLVCVEAGQSLDQSIIRVAKEIRAGFPALADEYEIVAHEMKAGKDKVNVLKDMAERCGVPDISSFTTVLIQSASFGTSIAEALRVYAGEMRDKRVMRAEEKANVLPTKLTLGTMMFTVPPLLIILIGPSVYDIMDVLGGGGGGLP